MVSALPVVAAAAVGLWYLSKGKASAAAPDSERAGAKEAAKAAAKAERALPAGKPSAGGSTQTVKPAIKVPNLAASIVQPAFKVPSAAVKAPVKAPVKPAFGMPVRPVLKPPAPVPKGPVNAATVSVLSAQKLLQKLGVSFGKMDGLYGPKTQAAWASAVRRWPPAQGPDFDKRENFGRLDGKTAQVYRPSMEALVAASQGAQKPVNMAKPAPVFTAGIQQKPAPAKQPPAGFDRARAKSTAAQLAAHLKSKGRANYSRQALKQWQVLAGIDVDGIYGRGSAAALKYYVGSAAPAAFFAQGVDSYPWSSP